MVQITETTGKTICPPAGNRPAASRILEDVLGCKWTLAVLGQSRCGTCRSGALVRNIEGLTTKVLNERLTKLVRFGILEKISHTEVPPRVEYSLSDLGLRFMRILDEVDRLERDLAKPVREKAKEKWRPRGTKTTRPVGEHPSHESRAR